MGIDNKRGKSIFKKVLAHLYQLLDLPFEIHKLLLLVKVLFMNNPLLRPFDI